MILRVTSAVYGVTSPHFESLLLAGAFPEVNYQKNGRWVSYNMFEYSNTHARYMKLIDKRMKVELDPDYGVFTRKHSKSFLEKLKKLVSEIREVDVITQADRFHSFADDVMAEAMK